VVDSPPISADWPADGEGARGGEADWPSIAQADAEAHEEAVSTHRSRLGRLFRLPRLPPIPGLPRASLPVACAAMGALAVAADRLARRNGAPAAADRNILQTWSAWR